MSVSSDLPALTADEAAHGARLEARLREEIAAAGGWIGFARYMQLALYEPGLGYYSAGARKFGAAGDFITAPEVAPVFSRCLAAQCAEVERRVGRNRLIAITGKPALTGFTAGKLLWVREHEPGVYERAAKMLLPKDFVRLRLTAGQTESEAVVAWAAGHVEVAVGATREGRVEGAASATDDAGGAGRGPERIGLRANSIVPVPIPTRLPHIDKNVTMVVN